jgi:hypothetical protein
MAHLDNISLDISETTKAQAETSEEITGGMKHVSNSLIKLENIAAEFEKIIVSFRLNEHSDPEEKIVSAS